MSDIFTNQEETNSNSNKETADLIVTKLMEIKRPDGTPKYESVESALDALRASQEHIQRIENDNADLKKKVEEAQTLKDTLARLEADKDNEKRNPLTEGESGRTVEAAEELVKKLVRQSLDENKQVETAVSNVKKVNDVLVNKFGEKAGDVVSSKAKSLGMTTQQLKELSAQNPTLVLELFGSSSTATSPNTSSVNLSGYKKPEEELKAPEKSLISGRGATLQNQVDYLQKIRTNVYKRLNVEN